MESREHRIKGDKCPKEGVPGSKAVGTHIQEQVWGYREGKTTEYTPKKARIWEQRCYEVPPSAERAVGGQI